ncbi:MAG: sigma-54-dependent Fis family transcriptional regulator [Magnetococcales bacterium]|nr:sigma-54-dependent Fis family transcriptional regulator [Magnetococcales bacterium]
METKESFLGQSPEFLSVMRAAALVAPTDASVLISGESGTGKELLARYIFQNSRRNRHAWVTINCAALPESLAESELFGHARGAFTGATQNKKGWVQDADGGTLFLDEISELLPTIQPKLLRLLESGECQGVGHSRISQVNIRVIAATNKYLPDLIRAGTFRADLFHRLNIVPLELPPLRERIADLPPLINRFLAATAEKNRTAPTHFHPDALAALRRYDWPGNIRELRNFCERVSILNPGRCLSVKDLPHEIRLTDQRTDEPSQNRFVLPHTGVNFWQMEQDLIGQALRRTDGNKSQAAKLLGLSRDTFLYRLKKFSIPV